MNGVVGIMLLVDLIGLAVILFIVWWFWLYKPRVKAGQIEAGHGEPVEIVLKDGTYNPTRIEMSAGQSVVLRFIRQDAAETAATVQFGNLSISAELPLNQPVDIQLPALTPGEYAFGCQMNRYRGTLVIK